MTRIHSISRSACCTYWPLARPSGSRSRARRGASALSRRAHVNLEKGRLAALLWIAAEKGAARVITCNHIITPTTMGGGVLNHYSHRECWAPGDHTLLIRTTHG